MIISNIINYISIKIILLGLKSINFNIEKYYFGRFNISNDIFANFKFTNIKPIKF